MNFFTLLPVCIALSMKSQEIVNIPLNELFVFTIIASPTLFKSPTVKASVQSSSNFWSILIFLWRQERS